ncbi:COG1470 family protein [Streptomyces nodosus]
MSLSASLDESSVTVEPGGRADLPVQVLNSGTIVEECRFEVVGPCADWATVEPESLSLYPGATGSATVRLHPPRTSQVAPGETPLGLRVVPTSDGGEPAVLERTVTVGQFTETTAELVPPGSSGAWRGRHRLAVDSRGNTPVTIALSARGATERSRLALDPAELEIPPGQAKFATLTVRPAKRLWRGTPITHPFQVTVAPRVEEGQEPQQPVIVDGSYEQQAVLPRWLPRVLMVAVLVAAALVGLWYSVLRPAVRSAAREAITPAVVESAARQGDAEANGGGNGKGEGAPDGGKGGSAGSGDASAAPGGDTSSAPGGGATGKPGEPGGPALPKSARVQVQSAVGGGATRRTAYTVPKGKTFELTDIVVQNPQGDAGTLVIAADDGQLLNLALENFRDSDYHFVTPIEVPSGGRITIAVSCRQVGKPVKAPAPSRCSESLFLGGKISANGEAEG